MTKAAFTPGPWRVEVDNVFAGPISNSIYVADCNPMNARDAGGSDPSTNPTSEANATLIASAPALYEALETCLAIGGEQLKRSMNLSGKSPYDIGLEALSLARGES